jgi:hypothetical protein
VVELIPALRASERVTALDHQTARRTGQTVVGFICLGAGEVPGRQVCVRRRLEQ